MAALEAADTESRGKAFLSRQSVPMADQSGVSGARRPFARTTTFDMKTDGVGGGFSDAAESIDNHFKQNILPKSQLQNGFLDCQRMIDMETGECVIISFWETEEDCINSHNNNAYYHDGLARIRQFARHGMVKTEHFALSTLHPVGDDVITSPYVRLTKLMLDVPDGNVAAVAGRADAFFQTQIATGDPQGFRGAQRLIGTGDATGTYIFLSYWCSVGTLRGSTSGTPYNDTFKPEIEVPRWATEVRPFVKPGSDTSTRLFEHLHYDTARIVPSFFEEGSARAAVFQLTCISLGVGIFTMPSVFASVGLVTGCGLLVGFAILSDFCIQLMLQCATSTGAGTYEDVLGHAFGPVGRVVALASMVCSLWTANCAHMEFSASMFVNLQGSSGGYLQQVVGPNVKVQTFAAMLQFGMIALPLSMKRRLNDLRHISLLVVVFCLFVSVVVVVKSFGLIASDGAQNTAPVKAVGVGDLLDIAPVACFGFSGIAELFSVRAEAKEKEKLGKAAHIATAIVTCIYVAVGLVGSMAIRSPNSNVLLNFDGDRFVSLLMFGLCIVITLLYPLINFPVVGALDAMVAGLSGGPSMKRRRILSVVMLVLTLLLDAVVKDLGLLFGLSGSLGLGLFAYVLPTLAFLSLAYKRRDIIQPSRMKIAFAVLVLALGLVMTIGSTGRIIYTAVTSPAP